MNNRLDVNNTALLYNSLNQLLSYATTEFSYDSQGNLLRKILDGEETRFTNNALSQLINIEKPDQTALSFSYDPLGRLLVEKHLDVKGKNKKNLSTRRYLYLGYQEIGTLSPTGTVESLKVPGISGAEISSKSIALEIGGNLYAPLHDQTGNVIQLIDPYSRDVIESYDYTAFGETHIFDGEGKEQKTALNPWQFAEKRYDDVSGFILFGLRFYDPHSGRWISQDPVGEWDGPNPYAYLHNNPLNHFDRLGLATESDSPNRLEEYMYGEVESHCYCEKHRTCKRGGDIGSTAAKKASPLLYFDSFERLCGDDEGSKTYDLGVDGRPDLPNGLGIGFINGVWNRYEDAKESVEYISRFSGGYNIHAVYNATHGALDLPECGLGLIGIATEPVKQLHKMWNSFFEKSNKQVKFLMICHSQGAIHVRNALLDYSPELRKRILVVAIAPAAYIYLMLCAQVVHYRAAWWRDGIPRGDVLGALWTASTIFTLSSHREAPLFDHPFMSPTYKTYLRGHIKNYIRSKGRIF